MVHRTNLLHVPPFICTHYIQWLRLGTEPYIFVLGFNRHSPQQPNGRKRTSLGEKVLPPKLAFHEHLTVDSNRTNSATTRQQDTMRNQPIGKMKQSQNSMSRLCIPQPPSIASQIRGDDDSEPDDASNDSERENPLREVIQRNLDQSLSPSSNESATPRVERMLLLTPCDRTTATTHVDKDLSVSDYGIEPSEVNIPVIDGEISNEGGLKYQQQLLLSRLGANSPTVRRRSSLYEHSGSRHSFSSNPPIASHQQLEARTVVCVSCL